MYLFMLGIRDEECHFLEITGSKCYTIPSRLETRPATFGSMVTVIYGQLRPMEQRKKKE